MAKIKVKRKRDPLSPKPILDKKHLLSALESKGIYLTQLQLATFYQLLHRQHYPELKTFVEQYYHEANGTTPSNANTNNLPTKNPISSKKKNLGRELPKAFLQFLSDDSNDFVTVTSKILSKPTSKDGTTTKMAVELQDGHVVESVLMRHVSNKGSRATVCVSSQVGCAMGCTFCATGTMGIRGDLCTGEILEQLVHAGYILTEEALGLAHDNSGDGGTGSNGINGNETKNKKSENLIVMADGTKKKKSEISLNFVRNVVFMGMGEPLNNYENVVEACRSMIDRRRWNMSHSRVTVSTVGVTPKMRKLTKELPEVNLALSLHAPNQAAREAIVPTAKMYHIEDMVDALDEHMMALEKLRSSGGNRGKSSGSATTESTKVVFGPEQRKSASKKKRAMIEYVMLEGETSSLECAHQLGKLTENRHLVVNLIPYNQTDVKDKLRCPSEEHMKEFQRIVTSYDSFCFIRRTMGADIAGACGQLVVSKNNDEDAANHVDVDIEDGPFQSKRMKQKPKGRIGRKSKANNEDESDETKNGKATGDIDKWIRPLTIATIVAASCFTLSIVLAASRRRTR